jgi:hypothetical protein
MERCDSTEKGEIKIMASATKTAKARGGDGAALLKGSNLPKSKKSVTVFVNAVREAPDEWKSPLVMDIDPVYECGTIALNKTNVKLLVQMIGDDYEAWAGYEVTFAKVLVNNPQTHRMTAGLLVESVNKTKRKPKVIEDDSVPF